MERGRMKTRIVMVLFTLLFVGVGLAGQLEDGWAAYNSGEYEKAYDLFFKAFRADPGSIDANFALGKAAYQKKKYSHALFAYDRVLLSEPKDQKALRGKADVLLALGQEEEARVEYTALLKMDISPSMRADINKKVSAIDAKNREVKLKGELSITAFYDDNINFGPSDFILGSVARDETAGIEVGVGISAEYDVGEKGGWQALGSASVLNSWLDSDTAQEARTIKLRAGVRKLKQRDLYEIVGRVEMVNYGHNSLVDIYGLDGAWLHAKTRDDYLITRVTVEHRDYDDGIDPNNNRDSIYMSVGETWKHFFENRRNTVSLSADIFTENARLDSNSNNGFRLGIEGERELAGGVIAYATGRFRLTNYEDATFGNPEREDQRWDLIVGARRRITKRCTLDLRHQYIRNDSNIAISDYNRHRTSLAAVFDF